MLFSQTEFEFFTFFYKLKKNGLISQAFGRKNFGTFEKQFLTNKKQFFNCTCTHFFVGMIDIRTTETLKMEKNSRDPDTNFP